MAKKPFLAKVYDLQGDGVRDYYDKWAATYEAEITENAYATPTRCAQALAGLGIAPDTAILDFACGTGLSGVALRDAGFTVFDGMDVSDGMLDKARAKTIYRTLTKVASDAPPPVPQDAYSAITAMGAIGPGAAPASVIAPLLAALPKGGHFIVSLNDVALEHPEFLSALTTAPATEVISQERGAHLPGIDVQSTVYVLRKT